ncbi:MAG: hypothetical protein HYU02_01335 [Thaumarchaeota archaeon]|nr:hypothetical protein [Nitrososphaerota archaeon]
MGHVSDKPKEEPQKAEWTPESVENLIKLVDTLAGKYITYKQNEAEADNKYLAIATRHNRNLTVALAGFLAIITSLMAYLTLLNRVSGDALLFLVGTITGYVIMFIQRLVFGTTPSEPAPEGA